MRFTALDGWRGLASLMVALFHLGAAGWFHDLPPIRNGGVAVPLFFVLSGFVIHHATIDTRWTATEVWRFVVRRFGRLYPLHVVTLGALVGLEGVKLILTQVGVAAGQAPFTGTNSLDSLAAHLLLLQAVIPLGYFSWNIPSWSIGVEWAVYLAFAAVAVTAGRQVRATGLVLTILTGVAVACIDGLHPGIGMMNGKGLLLGLFGFFAGGQIYRLYRSLARRGFRGGLVSELAACVVVGILFWFPSSDGLCIAGFSVVILIFAFESGPVSRWLSQPAFSFIGKISYSIYLVHFVLLSVLGGVIRTAQSLTGVTLMRGDLIDFGPPGAMDALAVVYLAVVVLCAWATYVWVEVPGRTFFNALSDRKPIAQAWRAALGGVSPSAAR